MNAHPVAEPVRLAAPLGGFVSRLRQAPVEKIEKLVPRDTDPRARWREDAERDYREIVERIRVPAAARRLVEDFLGRTPPADPDALVFCHNDLGSEHILVDVEANTVTGVIESITAATPLRRCCSPNSYAPTGRIDPIPVVDHLASTDGIVFVKDVPAGERWWPAA